MVYFKGSFPRANEPPREQSFGPLRPGGSWRLSGNSS